MYMYVTVTQSLTIYVKLHPPHCLHFSGGEHLLNGFADVVHANQLACTPLGTGLAGEDVVTKMRKENSQNTLQLLLRVHVRNCLATIFFAGFNLCGSALTCIAEIICGFNFRVSGVPPYESTRINFSRFLHLKDEHENHEN